MKRQSIAKSVKASIRQIFGLSFLKSYAKHYKNQSYLDGYAAHTDARVADDPAKAIGGSWDEMGELQFDFLKRMGLLPEHRMLDIGCGTMRGGRFFIRYLDLSNYTGVDISPACIDAAKRLVEEEALVDKRPNLIYNESKAMDFDDVKGEKFDYIFAQSVFSHLPDTIIEECFANVGKVMTSESSFYFTYIQSDVPKQQTIKDFSFPWTFFQELAENNGFDSEEVSHSYDHPRGQKMGVIRKTLE